MNEEDQDLVLVDPTSELHREFRDRLQRPQTLDGLTVGILDIKKDPGEIFLGRLDELLTGRGVKVKRYVKPHFSWEAPTELKQTIAEECDVLIEGLAD
ncbi:MAG: hypothetical protein A3H35_09300 [Betaproteobacteria bacterium RIFCSPLOWO2_02_FULL_62_17]|nr:MAG: hypothetical protein A3H35_09300 [Betaproteobacteria bacterium RIFCSPLOWO2_02_FULL_62_17]